MKVVATSDWHGEFPELPEGEVLFIVGDTLPSWNHNLQFQSVWTKEKLIPHLGSLPFERILLVGGNHDFLFQESTKWHKFLPENVTYLQDEEYVHDGIKFYGSPWSTQFGNWAFMDEDMNLQHLWSIIPADVDVLAVHGPPYGAGDRTEGLKRGNVWLWPPSNVGSRSLTHWIEEHEPKVVLTGHIHEAYGLHYVENVPVYNVSFMDLSYTPKNAPFVLDL